LQFPPGWAGDAVPVANVFATRISLQWRVAKTLATRELSIAMDPPGWRDQLV
jgi:hypothetical protein